MNKKRLGKGLGALIPDFQTEEIVLKEQGATEILLEKIKPNPHQPRKEFSREKLTELADTIKAYGVIQPVIVQRDETGYILVAGERRYKAAKIAGLETIPAVIKEYKEKELIEIALVENLQREDLNPLEEAHAYKRLMDEFGLIQEELAKRIGRSRSAVANTLRLLTLDDEIKRYLVEEKLSPGQARPLLTLDNGEQQRDYAQRIIKDKLTARQAEDLVKNRQREKTARQSNDDKKEKKQEIQLFTQESEDKLRKMYGTKVAIKKERNGGRVELYYFSNADLERLLYLLLRERESECFT